MTVVAQVDTAVARAAWAVAAEAATAVAGWVAAAAAAGLVVEETAVAEVEVHQAARWEEWEVVVRLAAEIVEW